MTSSGFPENVSFQSHVCFMMKCVCNQQHPVDFCRNHLFLSSEVLENTPASVCFEQIYTAEFTSMRILFFLFVCHPSGSFFPPHGQLGLALFRVQWPLPCPTCPGEDEEQDRGRWELPADILPPGLPLRSGWDIVEGKKGGRTNRFRPLGVGVGGHCHDNDTFLMGCH